MKSVSSTQLDKRRIAVLPFANMSPDPADEYFADGMTEEMISTLSNISGLMVISRTSTTQYKGRALLWFPHHALTMSFGVSWFLIS